MRGNGTRITGAGVGRLAALGRLRELDLSAAPALPVASLRRLAQLPLQTLGLAWTTIDYDDTTTDLSALRAVWPGAEVAWYRPFR